MSITFFVQVLLWVSDAAGDSIGLSQFGGKHGHVRLCGLQIMFLVLTPPDAHFSHTHNGLALSFHTVFYGKY